MRPRDAVAIGRSPPINGVLSALPPHGPRPCEGRAAGGQKVRGRTGHGFLAGSPRPAPLRRTAPGATAARTPPASGSPAPNGFACDYTPRRGTDPTAATRRRSRGTPSRPPVLP